MKWAMLGSSVVEQEEKQGRDINTMFSGACDKYQIQISETHSGPPCILLPCPALRNDLRFSAERRQTSKLSVADLDACMFLGLD